MRLDEADHNVGPAITAPGALAEHRKGLPNARRRPHVYAEVSGRGDFLRSFGRMLLLAHFISCTGSPLHLRKSFVQLQDVDVAAAEERPLGVVSLVLDQRLQPIRRDASGL